MRWLVGILVLALLGPACHGVVHDRGVAARGIQPDTGRSVVTATAVFRSHPRGPDPSDSPRVSSGWLRPGWSGGGRHPIWRGCQHVYDPALNAFINGSALPERSSGP